MVTYHDSRSPLLPCCDQQRHVRCCTIRSATATAQASAAGAAAGTTKTARSTSRGHQRSAMCGSMFHLDMTLAVASKQVCVRHTYPDRLAAPSAGYCNPLPEHSPAHFAGNCSKRTSSTPSSTQLAVSERCWCCTSICDIRSRASMPSKTQKVS